MTVLSQTLAVAAKDARIEWRGRARTAAILGFAGTVLLLFSFAAAADTKTLTTHAAGYFWLALLLGSVLSLADAFRIETEDDALDGLLLLPVDPRAIFLGKALARTGALTVLALMLMPIAAVLYNVGVDGSWLQLAAFIVLGVAGLAAPGTLYSAMTSQVRGREVLLPHLLFPLVVPVVLAVVKGSGLALAGDPMGQASSWLGVLAVFDLVYWSVCPLVFSAVVER